MIRPIRERSTTLVRVLLGIFMFAATAVADPPGHSHPPSAHCALSSVHEHVREQVARYRPLSSRREYFGFIYLFDGKVASAVVRGRECRNSYHCIIDTAGAARAIPRGARLLGEWHTHPDTGSHQLSADDVRGVRHFRHIPCYQAYYSTPRGEIYAWDIRQTSVPAAMATRVRLGPLIPSHG